MTDRTRASSHGSPAESPTPALAAPAIAAHVIMFWVLTGMALAVFAPCVIVPVYQDVETARDYRQQMAGVVGELNAVIRKNQARIDGLREDPLVNERIARRELNYQGEAEQIVRVTSQELAALRVHLTDQAPAADAIPTTETARWMQAATHWLPAWPYRRLFGDPNNRLLLMLMAGGLLVAAFVLYGRLPTPQPTRLKS